MDNETNGASGQAATPAAGSETTAHAPRNYLDDILKDVEAEAAAGTSAEGEAAETPAEPASEEPASEPEAEPEAPTKDGGEDGDDEAEAEAPKPKKRSGIERYRAKIERLEAELAEARSQPKGDSGDLGKAVEAEIGAPPKEEDFEDFFAYQRALMLYDARKDRAEERLKGRQGEADRRAQTARDEIVEAYEDAKEEARAAIPDFDKVLAGAKSAKVAPHVEEIILGSDKPALLAYYFAKSPEKLAEVNALTATQAARRIGALESRLSLPKATPTATKAPAPPRQVGGAATPSSPEREMEAYLRATYGR